MTKTLAAVLVGAGDRGYSSYGPYALKHPHQIRFVAVAEPIERRRQRFAQAHAIPPQRQYHNWEELFAEKQMADVALVTTLDHLHFAPTVAALKAGYHVMLEKPMATTLADCIQMVKTSEEAGRLLQICHQMRYTNFFSEMQKITSSGRLGEIVTVDYRENLINWAQVHGFVRGHWRNSKLECPKVLAKGCHDLDLIYWMFGAPKKLSSFGSLLHFRPENAPQGAPERCTDGCPIADECIWYAPRFYIELIPLIQMARRYAHWWERLGANLILDHPRLMSGLRKLIPPLDKALDYRGWPISVISEEDSVEARLQALKTGPWGRCVYHCDNDVVDHQVISMEMESSASVVLTMNGHSHEEARSIRIDGTRATLRAKFTDGLGDDSIEIHDHRSGHVEYIPVERSRQAHGGGDEKVMAAFIQAVSGASPSLTSARESLESHLMAFAAEHARLNNIVIDMTAFRAELGL